MSVPEEKQAKSVRVGPQLGGSNFKEITIERVDLL